MAAEEDIARFLFHGSMLYASGQGAKPNAYLPRDGKTSVFRVGGFDDNAVRSLGTRHLKAPPPIAHAVSLASAVFDSGLRFDPDNTPERHANIVGWPTRKEEQKLLAMKIVAAARVVRYG